MPIASTALRRALGSGEVSSVTGLRSTTAVASLAPPAAVEDEDDEDGAAAADDDADDDEGEGAAMGTANGREVGSCGFSVAGFFFRVGSGRPFLRAEAAVGAM